MLFRWLLIYVFALVSAINPALAALTITQLKGFNVARTSGGVVTMAFAGAAASGGTGATYTVSLTSMALGTRPGAIQTGDLLIAVVWHAATTDTNPGIDASDTSGLTWTEVADLYANDTADINLSVSWAIVTGTPPTAAIFTGSNNAANSGASAVYAFTGANLTTPMDVSVTTATGINTADPDDPAITPVTTGATFFTIHASAEPNNSTFAYAADSPNLGYSGGSANNAAGTVNDGDMVGSAKPNAGIAGVTEDRPLQPFDGTDSTSNSWAAVMMAIRPASN